MAEKNECSCNAVCGCVGYAYVPVQQLTEVFDVETALNKGSLFPELALTIDEYGKVCKQLGGNA